MPCALARASTSATCATRRGRSAAGSRASSRRSGRSRSSRRTRDTCCRASRDRRSSDARGPGRRTRRTCRRRHACAAVSVIGQHEVGRRRALEHRAGQAERRAPAGISIEIGWPSIAASASMPPTPHPITPRPFTIVVCESVPTSVSGNATVPSGRSAGHDDAREILEVHLMDDAGVGRDDAEVVGRRPGPSAGTRSAPCCARTRARRSAETRWPGRNSRPAPSDR